MTERTDEEIEAIIEHKLKAKDAEFQTRYPRGLYRLKADVENPHADRRSNDWYKQPVISTGIMLCVNYWPRGGAHITAPAHGYGRIENTAELFTLLLDNAERVPITTVAEAMMERHEPGFGWNVEGMLEHLISIGRITLSDAITLINMDRDNVFCKDDEG
jgi:hypothetical protein